MKTFSAKPNQVKREWLLIDANGKTLGRLASKIAKYLTGKHRPEYTPHVDTGDYVVVVNARKVALTGNKYKDKIYYRHTGYVGGIKSTSFEKMIDRNPRAVIENAVRGMLPKSSLGRRMSKKLKVYDDSYHPHIGQQPRIFEI